MDVNSYDAFSTTLITTKSQDSAYSFVNEVCKNKNIDFNHYTDVFTKPDLLHAFVCGLVRGGIIEYHRQLRANLAEHGIDLDNFVELPSISSND